MAIRSKILIVDDEPFNVEILEQELEEHGYDTMSAHNGQEALELVKAAPPDLILLDVMMPVMDGFTVCRHLKEQEDTRLIPIVIMTALDAIDDRIKGIEAGADDFLTKPIDDRELMARIGTALRLKHTVDRKLVELGRIKDHFAKFVPEAVKRLVAENPDTPELSKRECDVTVLFLDISGYTLLCEQLPPDVLNVLVEQYFSTFLDCIHHVGGDINETAGDGFMAIFQEPDPHRHAIRAVETAIKLLNATQALNMDNRERPLDVHIGINSGLALVGSTRFEGVRGTRWTFTASGPVTNLAARLSGVAEADQILLGQETARRVGNRFELQRFRKAGLKNIAETVDVYRVTKPETGYCSHSCETAP